MYYKQRARILLKIVTVSLLQIGAENHCFQVNCIDRINTDCSHKGRPGNLFLALLSVHQSKGYQSSGKPAHQFRSTHSAIWYSMETLSCRCVTRPLSIVTPTCDLRKVGT